MRTTATVAALAATATAVAAASEQAVYWGQMDSEKGLGDYCDAKQGIDIIVLSFLANYGNGQTPNGNFGNECSVDNSGNASGCDNLINDINTCRNNGKKIIVSLGGGGAPGALSSDDDATQTADALWNMFGNPSDKSGSRPFGDFVVDGWDLDIENPNGQEYYKTLMAQLRKNFEADTSRKYYITGAPECPWPEPNMGDYVQNGQFDYLFIQFYNNPDCSAYQYVRKDDEAGPDGFNFDTWVNNLANSPSKDAKFLIGLPASDSASGYEGEPGTKFYLTPDDEMPKLVNDFKSHAGFGGVMLWDAGNSDIGTNGAGCTYAQSVRSVLDSGNACTDPNAAPAAPSATTSAAPPASTSGSAVPTTLSTVTSSAPSSGATCAWEGHCAGAACSADTDCSDPFSCQSGKCA